MAGLEEINSFVTKFVSLWRNGIQARLFMETEAGKASINLCADLGQTCLPPVQNRRVGGSRLRRRERRAEARQVAAAEAARAEEATKAEEAIQAKDTEKVEKASGVAEEAVQVDIDAEEPPVKAASGKEVEIAADEESDDIAKEADDNIDSDCDVYIFTYWDNFKVSEAQEAINYIEESLKKNFEKNKVKALDRVFKIYDIKNSDDNEIQVKIKMKKNNWPVELSARNVQTAYNPGNPVSVSIKSIQR